MTNSNFRSAWRRGIAPSLAGLLAAALATSCGGGTGGTGTGDTIEGVILVDFVQSGLDNLPLNRTLEFRFSSPIQPSSVGPASIQVRQGPEYGNAVDGTYVVQGDRVYFEPRLPGRCDLSDAGFQPDTPYRVTLIGSPEEFAIRNLSGDPLQATVSASFSTRNDTDPELFEDQLPGVLPTVVSTTPADESAQNTVGSANKLQIVFSENLNPCSVSDTTVLLYQYATGDLVNGFVPAFDTAPGDDFSWGSGTPTLPPRRIRCTYDLQQDLLKTTLTLTPIFGEWPDNALLVCQVTNQVKDFGGNPLVPYTFSFTTENRPAQTKSRVFHFDGDVPILVNETTAEVNTARTPSRAQGFLLVAGDGDNGANLLTPSGPDTSKGPVGCTASGFQPNDGNPDDFDPASDVLLSTGATRNTCRNSTDGSTAVTFEYRTFRIRAGVTVRVTGVNAAIILVRGDAVIESGGRLLARGDGAGGSPNSAGANGVSNNETAKPAGGTGVAGGGNGGTTNNTTTLAIIYGGNGAAGFGSPDFGLPAGNGGATDPIRKGAGRGAVGNTTTSYPPPPNRMCVSGGGAGHGKAGAAGTANGTGSSPFALMDAFVDGAGGTSYGDTSGSMPTAEAGSGGGAGGTHIPEPWNSSGVLGAGGAGGAGGGFVDITSSTTIRVFGSIDAAGSRGGNGAVSNGVGGFFGGGGGGGGGSGGGIRLLTPGTIVLGAGATLTVAGGSGGTSPVYAGAPQNFAGAGGVGRLVLEDSDGVIQGLASASVTPGEAQNTGGDKVFYRGTFNGARFQGGGLRPVAVTNLIDIGPFSPDYVVPSQDYGAVPGAVPPSPRVDFVAGVPNVASRGIGTAAIFIEVQGYPANPDGTPNLSLPSGWKSVGTFLDSGAETFPTWLPNAKPNPADVPPGNLLPGNTGNGIDQIDGRQFMQFRITFFLPPTVDPFDPGPYVDSWALWFTYDQ
jgi:hypothetical protein